MSLNPIEPRLRPVRNAAVSPTKVQLSVQPGETLIVSDDIAGQLAASSSHFKVGDASVDEVDTPSPAKKRAAKRAPKPEDD